MKLLELEHKNIIDRQPEYNLSASIGVGVTAIQVNNIEASYGVNSYLWIDYGKTNGEIVLVSEVNETTNTFTVSATKYGHAPNSLLYNIEYNQVDFAYSVNTTVSPSRLILMDIVASRGETSYTDLVNIEGLGYLRLYNEATDTFEPMYSGPSPYKIGTQTVKFAIDMALQNLHFQDKKYFMTDTYVVGLMNVLEASHGQKMKRPMEVQEREFNLGTLNQGEWELPLPANIAEKFTNRSIEHLRIKGSTELQFMYKNEFNKYLAETAYDELNSGLQTTDLEVTLKDATSFPSAGYVYIGNDKVTYTSRSSTKLLGVSGITAAHNTGTLVTAGLTQGKPHTFTIWNNKIYVYPVMGNEFAGYPMYMDYFSKLGQRLQSIYDEHIFESINIAVMWLEKHAIKKDNQGSLTSGQRSAEQEFEDFWSDYLSGQSKVSKNKLKHSMDRRFNRNRGIKSRF